MPNQKLDKNFLPNKKEINYLNKSFPQFRQSLIDFARTYFPDSYNDFNESSPGMMFIEMSAYVGDVLSYYLDTQFRENLLQFAEEEDNIISIAQSLGYKPKPSTAAVANIDVYQLVPALDYTENYDPDPNYMLKIASGMVVSSPEFGSQFRTTELLDFANPINREVTIYAVDGIGKPQMYLLKKSVRVVAGTIKTFTKTFTSPQKFSSVVLPDENVLEIIRVTDSSGEKWYEVDFLAQDLVFEDVINTTASDTGVAPFYIIQPRKTPRRFVTRYNENFLLELQFGSGVNDVDDSVINLDGGKIATDEYINSLASTSLDPSDFLDTRTYGLSPANTELTITYSIGGGLEANVPTNAITKIDTVTVLNDRTAFSSGGPLELYDIVVGSVAVNNPFPATGGRGADSVEEIRQNAMAFANAQNRLVTPEDYTVRCYAMPPKYGGISKVFVARDEQINDILRNNNNFAPQGGEFVQNSVGANIVNLYVLGYDHRKKLTRLNTQIKQNLKTYLENYRILTDEIRILDAFVINIGVEFKVVVYRGYNMNEVLARAIDAVKTFFDIDRWKLNQPIVQRDLLLEIARVEGVQNVDSLKITNKYRFKDGSDYEDYLYDIKDATEKGVIYPSLDPSIFEVRYPDKDIIGSAIM